MNAFILFAALLGTSIAFAQDQACDSSANANKLCVQGGKIGVCSYDVRCNIPVACTVTTLHQFCVSAETKDNIVTYFQGVCGTDLNGYACVTANDAFDPIKTSPLELGIRE